MTNDNTRTKANAVFFSVIMVISMVAIGFAAAPAAAQSSGDITLNSLDPTEVSQEQVTHSFEINVSNLSAGETDLLAFNQPIATVASAQNADSSNNVTVGTSGGNITLNNPSAASAESSVVVTGDLTVDWTSVSAGSTNVLVSYDNGNDGSFEVSGTTLGSVTVLDSRSSTTTSKNVDNGDTVFQNEEINFVGQLSGNTQLIGVNGNAEGQVLEENVDVEQTRGRYTTNGSSSAPGVTVTNPSINTAEIRLGGTDEDVDGSSVSSTDASNLDVYAEFNFEQAEPIEITVEDADGTDITDEVLNSNNALIESSDSSVNIDLGNEDAGEYTVTYEGEDDLDNAVQERTITVSSDDEVTVEANADSVTRGNNLGYTVSGGTSGDTHVVVIDADDFRDSFDASNNPRVFRNTGDTESIGYIDTNGNVATQAGNGTLGTIDFAYAEVEMDGSQASGSLRSNALDTTSVDLDVYPANVGAASISGSQDEDSDSFSVEEGELTIDSPGNTYTINSEVNVNGTAQGADNVDVYVRDQGDWQLLLANIDVNSDDEYEQEDVILSDSSDVATNNAANILGQSGSYRIGVVDQEEFQGQNSVGTTNFSRATSTTQSIRTVEGDLDAEITLINGQLNNDVDNAFDISGTANGQSSDGVSLIFVDRRGNVDAQNIDVDTDGTIDEEDVTIPSNLVEGTVTAHVVSPGRDGNIGNGDLPNGQSGPSGLENFVNNNISGQNLNGDQARSQILDQTTEDTASDDLMVTQSFRLAESQTTIDNVYPEGVEASGVNPVATGETMVVEGTTNLYPDDNSITVEVLNQDGESVEITSTDEWNTDGVWTVTIDTSDIETGSYVVESDDSENTDRAEIEIVEERQTDDGDDGSTDGDDGSTDGDDGSTDGDDGSTDGDDGSMDGDDGGSDGDDGGSDGGDGGTDDSTPGFGALVALVALIAAALLATRRND